MMRFILLLALAPTVLNSQRSPNFILYTDVFDNGGVTASSTQFTARGIVGQSAGLLSSSSPSFTARSGAECSFCSTDSITVFVEDVSSPGAAFLAQNYPNPFGGSTMIEFTLPNAGHVALRIFTLLGEELAAIQLGELPGGTHRYLWKVIDVPPGVYIYRLEGASFVQSRVMTLLR